MGGKSGACDVPGLMNVGTFCAVEPLFVTAKLQAALGQGHAFYREQFVVDLHQQIEVLLDGCRKWIDLVRAGPIDLRSEEHTSELQSHSDLVCRLLLEKKNKDTHTKIETKV